MKEEVKKNLKDTNAWLRVLFMILFGCIYSLAIIVMWVLVLFQLTFSLLTGSPNTKIEPFSRQLSKYIYEILLYLSYNTEEKPFPFADWPADTKKSKKKSEPAKTIINEEDKS